ncbi:MAG TPA: sensor domain-containing diguanylate cyclase [Leptospiraceae bacterium]|jgi:diguanylate cyclase (GGDEF)-like protein|nr:sensor domain-containing diguanylate cyclase [Leptospirales bacterium]HMU83958.1 sensor domain-containing diguanylate cyclase [Leptospiraceae bacterium]HMX58813.1 sensor domain-containing diguanylate cyclase [Leptospiraceae bacterium]HMY46669.1 sensor domain-containing diguanylate cyclase [Leptospiraceae bacterium]HMZ35348.1 sensor domain-containing diguanylate cyclase [Leptospiraceae bacterium]
MIQKSNYNSSPGDRKFDELLYERDRLYRILEVNTVISRSLRLDAVLTLLMEKAKEVTESEASSLMRVDEEKQELYFHTIQGDKSDAIRHIRLKIGEGIAGWVAKEGKPLLVADASKDPRFSRRADEASKFVTRSMMCVPLVVSRGVIGTVQVLNKKNGEFFNETDLRLFEVMANQAAIAIENARLHEMATVDGTTGLYKKDYFIMRMEEEFRRSRNTGKPMSVIMSDIDHFKNVNTQFGHLGGDAALVELARVIRETVQEEGPEMMPGRYGGEEFCVLIPGEGPEQALGLAEKIRKRIEAEPIHIGDQVTHITISIGVSSWPTHTEHIQALDDFFRLADEALYICKDRGRNCSSLYDPEHKRPPAKN